MPKIGREDLPSLRKPTGMSQITSFKSREVRWFLDRPFPKISQWFEKLPPTSYTRESREDTYLVLPGREDLGVKFRENRLELKFRLGRPESGEVTPGTAGVFESWEKLSFASSPETDSSVLPKDSAAKRVPVLKRRAASVIQTTDSGESFHPLGSLDTAGVQFEYTELQVMGSAWYTLGLEWPGDQSIALPSELLSDLLAPSGLLVTSSMGYPAFLQRLVHSTEEI